MAPGGLMTSLVPDENRKVCIDLLMFWCLIYDHYYDDYYHYYLL